MKVKITPTHKQHEAWQRLQDRITNFLYFGGAAGGGKSWLGCEWLITNCYFYPGSKWFIGREELKAIRDSTVITFYKVLTHHGIPHEAFKYNGQDHFFLHEETGSRIDLIELKHLPRDPMFERFGSKEYTGGWIEEGGEVDFGAFDVLKARIGRHMNDDYKLIPKMLITGNPKKNWTYNEFYKPHVDGTIEPNRAFIPALVTDNPHIGADYIDMLHQIKDKAKRERLLYGNFEYDDDPNTLMDYDCIVGMWSNAWVEEGRERYITADIARFGADKMVIMVWAGWRIIDITVIDKCSITEAADLIRTQAITHKVGMRNVLVDEDGLGGGVKDILNCKGFVANTKAVEVKGDKENYKNLKSQCYFHLADRVNTDQIFILHEDTDIQEAITEELHVIKDFKPDNDQKRSVMPKDMIKKLLGRSPDYADTMMMRQWFELKGGKIQAVAFG